MFYNNPFFHAPKIRWAYFNNDKNNQKNSQKYQQKQKKRERKIITIFVHPNQNN